MTDQPDPPAQPIQPAVAAFEGSVEPPARRLGGVKAVGILGILAGILLIVAGIVVAIMVPADASPEPSAWVVPYGLAALAVVTGILSILFGWAIHRLASAPVVLRPSRVAEL